MVSACQSCDPPSPALRDDVERFNVRPDMVSIVTHKRKGVQSASRGRRGSAGHPAHIACARNQDRFFRAAASIRSHESAFVSRIAFPMTASSSSRENGLAT